jgi:hypothetical protein
MDPASRFAELDTNKDDKLDSGEMGALPAPFGALVGQADTDKDGAVSKSEFTSAMQKMMSGRGRPGGQGGPGGGGPGGQGGPGGGGPGRGGAP